MRYFFTTILSVILLMSYGQDQASIMQKVEAAKIALITERLNLTPEQAEKFWPVYREFSQKQIELRQEFRELRSTHDPQSATDEENRKILEKGLQLKQQQINLEKTYSDQMQQVISARQMMNLRKAEDDFRQMLIQRVRDQQQRQDQMHQDRSREDFNRKREEDRTRDDHHRPGGG